MKALLGSNETDRAVVLDTETTGLTPEDKIIEIGAVEVIGSMETGRKYHVYINPYPRKVHPDAEKVHGLSDKFLFDKPKFRDVYREFLDFIGDSPLVIHNARFDMGFINRELKEVRYGELTNKIIDTLEIAREVFPGQRVTLDALCSKYGIDNSDRTLHGALIDASLLAQVYVKLTGRDRLDLRIDEIAPNDPELAAVSQEYSRIFRPSRGVIFPTPTEIADHAAFIEKNIPDGIWSNILPNS